MLLPGTQMHIVTFAFVCIEIAILIHLVIYRLGRPDDSNTSLNIWLVSLLLIYNIAGGLLPDPHIPGSVFIQEVIAYATGFITPSYFPYYVYKAFRLEKMKFHAFRGVFICLILPFILFVLLYAVSKNLRTAQDLLILPVLYAIWVIISLAKALKFKYVNDFKSKESKEEIVILFLSLTPWVGLPIIDFFNLGQCLEASVTNTGFLLLLALQLKLTVSQLRREHLRVIASETRLLSWNSDLKKEVEKRTRELENITEQKINTFVNLAHETKTPLTLIRNYLEEYASKHPFSDELTVVKKSIDKLTTDVINLFDLERFNRGLSIYDHNLVSSLSEILKDNLVLFQIYADKKHIRLESDIQESVLLKADPISLNRIVNNLLENAIKFSDIDSNIRIKLLTTAYAIEFSVTDNGLGIPIDLHKKVFEPYFQITQKKRSSEGMGLGLPLVKNVVESLQGSIRIESDPQVRRGTSISILFPLHKFQKNEIIAPRLVIGNPTMDVEFIDTKDVIHDKTRHTILVVEDNRAMANYLIIKLKETYNVYSAANGSDALRTIKVAMIMPDLIVSDIMMDTMDGFALVNVISCDPFLNHIPVLFLSAINSEVDKLHGLDMGAVDFIHKPFSIQELANKIKSILLIVGNQKKVMVSDTISITRSVEAQYTNASEINLENKFEGNCQHYHLTSREKVIAKLICDGKRYKEIGSELFIAESTVMKHVQNIFEKMEVSNRIDLARRLTA